MPTQETAGKGRRATQGAPKRRRKAKPSGTASAVCGAKKQNGKPCMQPAGHGTDHPGRGQCRHHGGSTPGGIQKAAAEMARSLGHPIPVSPAQAITGVMHLSAGQLAFTTMKVAELGDDGIFTETKGGRMILSHWVRLQREYQADLARYCKVAADMGVQERQLHMAEMQTKMIGSLIEAVIGDLDLTKEQRANLGPAIRRHMASIDGSATEVTRA